MIPVNPNYSKTNVYFIQAECCGSIKIGWSHRAKQRFDYLQRFSACRLKMLAVRKAPISTESDYHRLFADHRLHGEWFTPHPDILTEVAEINASGESAMERFNETKPSRAIRLAKLREELAARFGVRDMETSSSASLAHEAQESRIGSRLHPIPFPPTER